MPLMPLRYTVTWIYCDVDAIGVENNVISMGLKVTFMLMGFQVTLMQCDIDTI